ATARTVRPRPVCSIACYCSGPGGHTARPSFLHDALPICIAVSVLAWRQGWPGYPTPMESAAAAAAGYLAFAGLALAYRRLRGVRSEEHTSELQSQSKIVCRLLLETNK